MFIGWCKKGEKRVEEKGEVGRRRVRCVCGAVNR